jgi:hypothetical protein
MGALIVQNIDFAVGIAGHDQRLVTDLGAKIIAGVSCLTLVADVDPGDAEDVSHLEFENIGIGVQAAMNAGWLYAMEEILGRMPLHLALPRTFEDNCVKSQNDTEQYRFTQVSDNPGAADGSDAHRASGRQAG